MERIRIDSTWKKIAIWLIPGAILLLFGNGSVVVPIASWLFPVFLLRFSRQMPVLKGFVLLAPVFSLVTVFAFWGTAAPEPGHFMQLLPGLLGFVLSLTFVVDRLLQGKIKGFQATLVFPLAYTSFDFLLARFSPLGSTGVLAYTQYANLSLIQLVSITGLWGLTYLITWFGAVVNWIIESDFQWDTIRRGVLIFSGAFLAVLLFGGLRLAFPVSAETTVPAAGLYVYDLRMDGAEIWQLSREDREAYRKRSQEIQDQLFDASETAAQGGAQIVVWSEISPYLDAEDLPQLNERARTFAFEHQVYLCIAPYIDYAGRAANENVLFLFAPDGEMVLKHYKFGGAMFEGTIAGDGVLRHVSTKWGQLSGVICWDQDFPHRMRQAGQAGTNIMLAPNADWDAITPMHTHMGVFRAIENGYALIRPNVNGLSVMTDAYGRVAASMDHNQTNEWFMLGQVPVYQIRTIYSMIGDLFGWLAVAALLGIMLVARRQTTRLRHVRQDNCMNRNIVPE